ncbi:MAG: hypothetical protein HY902_07145 [Deltaproteobacteria bacterium]|nr:hypothetical protein [Deltaproteobacteria bacterium]
MRAAALIKPGTFGGQFLLAEFIHLSLATAGGRQLFSPAPAAKLALLSITLISGPGVSAGTAMPIRLYDPSLLHLVTLRTLDGKFSLCTEDPDFQENLTGAMAEAQAATGVKVYAFTFMANHYHGLYSADFPEQMARFLCLLHAAVARLVNRRFGRRGPMWEQRAHVLPVLPGKQSEMQALSYVIMQAAKAGIVEHPRQYRGASSTGWLLDGAAVVGQHVRQTELTLAARNGKDPGEIKQFTDARTVKITPLPCFAATPADAWRETLRWLVDAQVSRAPENAPQCEDEAVRSEIAPQGDRDVDEVAQPSWDDLPTRPKPKAKARNYCIAPSHKAYLAFKERVVAYETSYADARCAARLAAVQAARGDAAAFVSFPMYSFACAAVAVPDRPTLNENAE